MFAMCSDTLKLSIFLAVKPCLDACAIMRLLYHVSYCVFIDNVRERESETVNGFRMCLMMFRRGFAQGSGPVCSTFLRHVLIAKDF